MNITGTVSNKNLQAAGHSQVRINAVFDLGDGVKREAEVIISTPDADLIEAFKLKQSVELSTVPSAPGARP